ncbi:MAG TPA: histidinol-phosphate transaminase [Burkholderiales bacterium]|nr:histidinol-phosphate transaminase [Burkholderiales bacterium]
MAKSPDELIRDEIRTLRAYHAPESVGLVKLDAMENPHALPPALQIEMAQLASRVAINRYPDPQATGLQSQLRKVLQVDDSIDILLGNGSDELIQIVALAVAKPGAVLLSVEPGFVMFRILATCAGLRYVGVPLKSDFALDAAAVIRAIKRHPPAVIFLAYPNNPTGNLFDARAVTRVIKAAPGLVVVDEAYHAFAGASFIPRLADHRNLLVMRTFSKLGMAGLRLGFLLGRAEWLAQLDKLRLPYNVNALTQAVAEKLLQHGAVFLEQAQQIKAEREKMHAELVALTGIKAYRSDANFILFRVNRADEVFKGLIQRGILVKNLNCSHPLLENCLRVTVGTAEQNQQFMQALKASLVN